MFAIATDYNELSPGLHITRFAELAWESFFESVSAGRMVTVVYYDTKNSSTLRVEFQDNEFKFSNY